MIRWSASLFGQSVAATGPASGGRIRKLGWRAPEYLFQAALESRCPACSDGSVGSQILRGPEMVRNNLTRVGTLIPGLL